MLSTLLDNLQSLWRSEPARVTSALVAIVVLVASQLGVVLDPLDVGQYVLLLGGILLGGERIRATVSPLHTIADRTVPTDVGDRRAAK